jgi:hypothetical protein
MRPDGALYLNYTRLVYFFANIKQKSFDLLYLFFEVVLEGPIESEFARTEIE